MIGSLLRDCTDVHGVARLFEELGYPVRAQELGADALGALGVEPSGSPIHHLTRYGGVDLYVSKTNSSESHERLRELERVLAERNHVVRPVIVELYEGRPQVLSIYGRCGSKRRRLDVDTTSPSPDALDRICGLMIRGRDQVDPGLLFERALDREEIGRRFLEQFRRSVARIAESFRARLPDESVDECRDQALLLLSRVLFVYLIQRKGWLDGDHRFFRERLATCLKRQRNFHASVVVPLFFDCLNKPRSKRPPEARRLGRIPYLNGGLFEPSSFESRNRVELENELWREVLDSTFEPYSLSVSEADEEGAHVDPEMLGRVFEKLMEGEERARTGSFYTPRDVVDRLTESAIVRWCAKGDRAVAASLSAMLGGAGCVAVEAEQAASLLRRLEGITVLDPACGSGAFLLAALRTIESLSRLLASIAGESPAVDLRARIAARSLYGVDLKMEAVRLCELRIWLAIVSGSELDVESVPPLPNLDRNVMQGNSLVGPLDFLEGEPAGIYKDWLLGLREREELLDEYRRSSSTRRRKLAARLRESDKSLAQKLLQRSLEHDRRDLVALRESDKGLFEGAPQLSFSTRTAVEDRMKSTERMLARLAREEISFFSFDLHFATIRARGGFAVVLGNPPWVRGSRVDAGLRQVLAGRYRSFGSDGSTGFRQSELAMAFVERSLSLAAPDGVVAQLVPSKLTSAEYAAAVRRMLLSDASLDEICDWSNSGKSLFGADVFPLGIVASKTGRRGPISFSGGREEYSIEYDEISVDTPGSAWSTLPPAVGAIVRRVRERFAPLSETLGRHPLMGVKTGANSRFFLESVEVDDHGTSVRALGLRLPPGAVVRAVRGRDLRRWNATDSTWMLWPAGINGDRRLAAAVAGKLGINAAPLRLGYVRSEHLGLKVAWKDVARELSAAILPDSRLIDGGSFSVVPNQTLYSIDVATMEEALVLEGMLNSTVVNALALETAERAKDHHWRYLANVIAAVPFPEIRPGSDEARTLARLARLAERGQGSEVELNACVAKLFGVTAEELVLLRKFVAGRLGRDDGCDE